MSKTMKAYRAFTLVELLIVISILTLLATLLIPSFQSVQDVARTTKCKANLYSLGVAYELRGSDVAQKTRSLYRPAVENPYVWPWLLGSYLDASDALTCPSDESLEELWDGEDPSDPNFDGFVSAPGYEWMCIANSDGQRVSVYVPMTNTHPVIATLPWGGTGREVDQTRHRVYDPKPDQSLVFTCARVKKWLTEGTDMGENFRVDRGGWSHEHQFSFVPIDETDTDVTLEAMGWKVQHGEKFLYNGIDGQHGRHYSKNYEVKHVNKWTPASYGMNNRAPQLGKGDRRVLLIDYEHVVADVVDAHDHAATDSWTHEMDKVKTRHSGKINVLWSDGSVQSMHPDQIDPGVSANVEQQWRPPHDR
ncbi:MAG: type II secretion system protein [Phycisphaerae bacterium]